MSAAHAWAVTCFLGLLCCACGPGSPEADREPRSTEQSAGPLAEVPFMDGTKHGVARIRDAEGRVRKRGRYEHDRKTGPWTAFDRAGDTLAVVNYREGLLDGESRAYGPGGVLLRRVTYRRGRMHGPYADHFPDGALHEQVSYRNGLREGPYLRFTRTDTLDNGPRLEGQYHRGRRTGIWRRYYGNGVQSEEGPLVEDVLDGRWTYWDRQGRPRLERVYVRGALVSEGPPR
ncbi:MAG TPA: hypothetical protein PLH93_11285 [Flavobacteriales bacterium]|nr:hypothetical protein [Flavobacteriales bacterium]HQW87765.1 hypothetical protein [Flavobacteriales bacterium]